VPPEGVPAEQFTAPLLLGHAVGGGFRSQPVWRANVIEGVLAELSRQRKIVQHTASLAPLLPGPDKRQPCL
jgi:hypothetical protein